MLSSRTGKHRKRGRTPGLAVSAPAQVVTITDWMGTAHLVIDEAMNPGDQSTGWYAAVCGVEVLAASPTDRASSQAHGHSAPITHR